jgi:hypothetical protein
MKRPFITCSILLLLISQFIFAQDSNSNSDSVSVTHKRKSYLKAELGYLSDNVYLGRSDSEKTPYITPSLTWHHKSGLFVGAGANFLATTGNLDLFNLTGGYAISKGNWDAEIVGDKYFYSSQSYTVRSEMKGDISLYSGYDLGFIEPSINATVTFGDATDYATTLGLDHEFSLLNDHFSITPGAFMNAASQNYYNNYFQKRRYATNRKGKKVLENITASTADAAKFRVLDYEFSLPLEYRQKRVTFSFIPTYAIPVNPNSVTTTVTSQGVSHTKIAYETLTNRFFWTANIAIKI